MAGPGRPKVPDIVIDGQEYFLPIHLRSRSAKLRIVNPKNPPRHEVPLGEANWGDVVVFRNGEYYITEKAKLWLLRHPAFKAKDFWIEGQVVTTAEQERVVGMVTVAKPASVVNP